jgi:hypothetical protein
MDLLSLGGLHGPLPGYGLFRPGPVRGRHRRDPAAGSRRTSKSVDVLRQE